MSNKNTALSFDASKVAPQTPMDILPVAWYHCEITAAETKATKGAKPGKTAAFEFTILAGEHKGRKLFANLNYENASAVAQEIGQRELSSICHAVGIVVVTDVTPFIGKQLQVKTKTRKATPAEIEKGYEDRSEPGGYKALDGASAAPSAPMIPSGPPMPPAPPTAPPAPPVAAPAAPAFPPVGWQANPNAPGWYWNPATGEQLEEAALRAQSAPPAPVAAPVAPPVPPAPPVAPPAPVAVEFPPAGWTAHPSSPGYYYSGQNVLSEADLRAQSVPAAPAAPAGPPLPPAAPVAGSPPPWKQ